MWSLILFSIFISKLTGYSEDGAIWCKNIGCESKSGCAMVEPIGCIMGSCDKIPVCIEKNDCENLDCPKGTECVLRQVQCFIAPCDPIGICVNNFNDFREECPENEEYSGCINECSERSCFQEVQFCAMKCRRSGCICRKGFYRSAEGKCITEMECTPKDLNPIRFARDVFSRQSFCGPNQRSVSCYNACQDPKCNQKEQMMCTMECRYPGCVCNDGFFRNRANKCVEKKDCDKERTIIL